MANQEIPVLLVEDEASKASTIKNLLEVTGPDYGYDFLVSHVHSVDEGLAHIDAYQPGTYCRVAILDQELGLEATGGAIVLDRLFEIPEQERPITIGFTSYEFGLSSRGNRVDKELKKIRMAELPATIHELIMLRQDQRLHT